MIENFAMTAVPYFLTIKLNFKPSLSSFFTIFSFFFRLNTIEIHLPPLRDRRSDIKALAETFLERHARHYRKAIEGFSAAAEEIEWVVHAVAENDETGVVMNERTDRFKIGGKWVEARVMGVFELRDGLICAWRDYFDMNQFMSQLR